MADFIVSTTYLWHAPELLPSDTTFIKSCNWQMYEPTIFNIDSTITATSIPDTITLGKTTDNLYKLIEKILNEGVGFHDSVVGFALPLFIALMAFSFGFLFDAINHINEKYDSPTISKIFEEHRLRKMFFKTTRVCVWIAGLYALLTLFLLGSSFWEEINLYVNLFVVLSSIVYALVTIGFAKFCMQFNKPNGVICLLEAKELRPFSSFRQRCKRLLAKAIHYKDDSWGIFQVYGKQLYTPWIDWQEQTDYIAGIVELSKHILKHRDSITFESVLKSAKKMSLRHNCSFEDEDSKSVISTMSSHRIISEFMIGIQKLLGQYPQSSDFYDNLCKWYLNSYDTSKLIGPYDLRQLQCILYAAVNNRDLMFLEKYIYRSASFFNYLNNLSLKSYVLGESKEITEKLRKNAHQQFEHLRNIHFCVMAYASYCGLHELLQPLTRLNNLECLYPTNRKDVLTRYASCLKKGLSTSCVDERLIENITGKRVEVEEMLGQYTSLMLILVTDKCTCKPLPKNDINFIEKSQPVLSKCANTLKSNSRLTSIYPQILSVDFSIVISDSVSSVRLPETYEPKQRGDKLSEENVNANRKIGFCGIIINYLLNKCGIKEEKQAERPKTNNYLAKVNLKKLEQFQNIFCCNHKVIECDFDQKMWNASGESTNKEIPIESYQARFPKLHFIYDQYKDVPSSFYMDCIRAIEDRIYYAYMTALGNMRIHSEKVKAHELDSCIAKYIQDKSNEYILLSFKSVVLGFDNIMVEKLNIDRSEYICQGLPMYDFFKDKYVLIKRESLPYLDGRDFLIAHSYEDSDENKGIMDIVTIVDSGLSVKYNKSSQIAVYNVVPTTLV